jgi:hypothetical protein
MMRTIFLTILFTGSLAAQVTIMNDGTTVGTRTNLNIIPGWGVLTLLSDTGTQINAQFSVDQAAIQTIAGAPIYTAQGAGFYWPFGHPQSSQPQAYPAMTACSPNCAAYGFEFVLMGGISVRKFAVRQSGTPGSAGSIGAFAIYTAAGALVAACSNSFLLTAANSALNCTATAANLTTGVYELVYASNSATATLSAPSSGNNVAALLENTGETIPRIFTITTNQPTLSGGVFTFNPTLGSRTAVNTVEPPHVLLLP